MKKWVIHIYINMTSESRFMKRDSSRNIRKLTSRPFKMRRRARFIGNSRDLLLHRFATTDGCILKRDAIIHRASNPLWRNPDSLAIPCKTPKHRRERRILTVAPHLGRMLVKKQGELLSATTPYPVSSPFEKSMGHEIATATVKGTVACVFAKDFPVFRALRVRGR